MKKVNITYYTKADKEYSFTLGNGAKFICTQEKKIQSELRKVNKNITPIIFDVNMQYIELHSIYRLYWASLDNPAFERKSKQVNNLIIDSLENVFIKRSDNYAIYVFMHLSNALDSCIQLQKYVFARAKTKSDTITVYRLESLLKRLIELKNSVDNFSILECSEKVEINNIIEINQLKIVS